MSKAAKSVMKIEVSLPPPFVLIVDDDDKFLERARDYFETIGFGVDTARTPEVAERMIKQNGHEKYLLVVTDVDFAGESKMRGDTFVLENRDLFGKAKRVIISGGQYLTPERRRQLKEANIPFLDKRHTLPQKLVEMTKEESRRRASDLQRAFKKETERITGTPAQITVAGHGGTAAAVALAPAPKPMPVPEPESGVVAEPKAHLNVLVVERLKQTLIRWLETRRERTKPVLAYGRQVYSAEDMIREVRDETEVGLEHVEMLLEEFEYSLGMNRDADASRSERDK